MASAALTMVAAASAADSIEGCDAMVVEFAALAALRCRSACQAWSRRWSRPEAWGPYVARGLDIGGLTLNGRGLHCLADFLDMVSPAKLKLDLTSLHDSGPSASSVVAAIFNDNLTTLDLNLSRCTLREAETLVRTMLAAINLRDLRLDLRFCCIRASGTEALALSLSSRLRALRLDLGGCGIQNSGAEALAKALRRMVRLERLDLSLGGCLLTRPGVSTLLSGAAACKRLRHLALNFYGNTLADAEADNPLFGCVAAPGISGADARGGPDVGSAGASAGQAEVSAAKGPAGVPAVSCGSTVPFAGLTSLLLNFSGCGLGDATAAAVSEQLFLLVSQHGTADVGLRDLSLNFVGCGIGDAGAAALAKRLPRHLTHLQVDFAGTDVTDAAANCLASHMPPQLTHLDLGFGGCRVTDPGVVAVARALPPTLEQLRLDLACDMNVTWRAASALFETLPSRLCKLDVSFRNCDLGVAGARAVAQGLAGAADLVALKLDFTGCGIGREGAAEIRECTGTLLARTPGPAQPNFEVLYPKSFDIVYDTFGVDTIICDPPDSEEEEVHVRRANQRRLISELVSLRQELMAAVLQRAGVEPATGDI